MFDSSAPPAGSPKRRPRYGGRILTTSPVVSKRLLSFTLALSAGLAAACSRQVKPDGPDTSGCTVLCERELECKASGVFDSVTACAQECEQSEEWVGPCASELQEYVECATRPEHACPTFAEVGLLNEDAPCYDENDLYSLCINKNTPAE